MDDVSPTKDQLLKSCARRIVELEKERDHYLDALTEIAHTPRARDHANIAREASPVAGTLGALTGGYRTTDLDGNGAYVVAREATHAC